LKPHRLPKPPIVEALVEFRVSRRPGLQIEDLRKLQAQLDEFPHVQERVDVRGQFTFAPGGISAAQDKRQTGYLAWDEQRQRCVNMSLDLFSFSRLPPYDSWETVRSDAEVLWERYREVAKPARVVQVGVRYINRILLPRGEPLAKYLRTYPQVSDGLPQVMAGLLLRLTLPQPDGKSLVTLTEAFERTNNPLVQPLILDIEASRPMPNDADSSPWDVASELRDIKNNVFFASIHRTALELFQ
jgi:uncharacterized protein (TIGR04255 family)